MSRKTKTTATKEEARPALVPKLQFPEFRGTEGWHSGPLKDSLSSISNGLALEQGNGTSGYRVTRIETISAGTIDLAKVGLIQTSDDISAYRLKVGDILLSNINSVAHIGKSVFVDRDYDLYHGMNLLRLEVNTNQHDPKFIFYAINTDWIRESLRERANKAVNQASINQTELGKTEVSLPLRPEQQKIAECLSSMDELMAAQARKVDALKTHKKGLMQQLFPREGETVPRLRFPEFRNAGEWMESPLSNFILSLDAGVSVNAGDRPAYKTEFGVLKTSAVTNGVFEPEVNKVVFAESELSRLKESVSGGTIIISRMNTPALVGANAYVESSHENLFLPDRLWAAKPREGVSMRFLAFILGSDKGRTALSKLAKGSSGSMKNITKPEVLAFSVMVPSPAEQQRIASCLSSLDALITAETQKLAALKVHKKGLMQQLFPSPEEVEA